jgi:hypothetical protein
MDILVFKKRSDLQSVKVGYPFATGNAEEIVQQFLSTGTFNNHSPV